MPSNNSRRKRTSQPRRERTPRANASTGASNEELTVRVDDVNTTAPVSARRETDRASERRQRRQDAIAAEKRAQQRNWLLGALAAALLVAGLLVYINRPTNDGGSIDYSGISTQSAPIVASAGTPGPSPSAPQGFVGTSIGDPNAPVTMAIYSDMQCPYCKQFHESILPKIIEDFVKPGKVRIEFREFPVLGHDGKQALGIESTNNESSQSAQAAMCSGEQNKYLEYQDKLFANQQGENNGAFNNDRLKKFADELGINRDQFDACMTSQKYVPVLKTSVEEGKALGITATPMFLLYNGSGAPNPVSMSSEGYDLLKSQIQTAVDTAK